MNHNQRPTSLLGWLDPYLFLLLGLCLLALTPLSAPGYFYDAHDGRHSVFYQIMFDASLRNGAWWPRWAMHHIQGYGYPTFIIQAPLGFYLTEIFVLAGAGYTLAAKLAWVTGFLAGAWGIYCLVNQWLAEDDEQTDGLRRLTALVAGLLYVFIPYHLVDIYVRAALNDSLLLGWFPWVLLAFDRLMTQGTAPGWPRRLAWTILTLGGTLLTHTFALISFAPLLVTFVLFRLGEQVVGGAPRGHPQGALWRVLLAGIGGVGGLLLCAAFLIPLFAEGPHLQQQVYVTNTYDFRNHFVYWGQFFSPFWGFGYSDDPQGGNDGMSFQLGVLALLLGMVALYVLWGRPQQRGLMFYLLGSTVALLLLMSPLTQPLWEAFPPLGVIQFPWRLLALVALTISALAGLTVWNLAATARSADLPTGGTLLVGMLVIFASTGYIQANLQPVEPWREDGRAIFRFEQEHPDMIAYTEWVKEPFQSSPMTKDYAAENYVENYSDTGVLERLAIIGGSGQVLSSYSRGSSFGGVVQIDTPATVRIHVLYFPGWQATLDGTPVDHRVSDPNGLVELDVPLGEHQIDLRMGSTPARRLGASISWLVLLGVGGLFVASEVRR